MLQWLRYILNSWTCMAVGPKVRNMLHTNLGCDKIQLDIQSKEGAPYSTQMNRTIVFK